MARLEWEKANRRERIRAEKATAQKNAKRQEALAAFVRKHDLTCFRCGDSKAEWAKTGVSKRGPWAICVPCVQAGRPDRPRSPIAKT